MLLPFLLAAVTSTPAFPAPGTYRYSASLATQRIGQWSVSVKADNGVTEVDENSAASIAGMQLSATASLTLGPDLAPLKYAGNYRTSGQNPSPAVALTATSATATGAVMATSPQQLSLISNTHHFVVIEPGLLAGLFALPAQVAAWKESAVTWIMPATAQAQMLQIDPATSGAAPNGVPAHDAVLSILRPVAVTIWYDPTTFVPDEIEIPSQKAVVTRERS